MLGIILPVVFLCAFLVIYGIGCFKVASQPDVYSPAKDRLKEAKKMEQEVFSRLGELEQKLKEAPSERDKQEIYSEMKDIQTVMNAWEQKLQETVRCLPIDCRNYGGGDGGDDGSEGGDDGGDGDD